MVAAELFVTGACHALVHRGHLQLSLQCFVTDLVRDVQHRGDDVILKNGLFFLSQQMETLSVTNQRDLLKKRDVGIPYKQAEQLDVIASI
jgi:hypothetical protein